MWPLAGCGSGFAFADTALGDKSEAHRVDPKIRKRPGRRLMGSLELAEAVGAVTAPGDDKPYSGADSLRAFLGADLHIAIHGPAEQG
jgi:hypothetical protein